MADSVIQYKAFNFFSNSHFVAYFENIFPTPNMKQLEKIKRKWYKSNIDPNFDINYDNMEYLNDFQKEEENDKKPHQSKNTENSTKFDNFSDHKTYTNEKTQNIPFLQNCLFTLEAYLKLAFIISFLWSKETSNSLGLTISSLALIRQNKIPKLTKEYAIKIIFSEHFQNICYFALFSFYADFINFLYYLPMMVHCWVGFCNYLLVNKGQTYQIFQKIVDITRNKEKSLLILKQKFEILLMIWLIFEIIFTNHFSAFLILLYATYIRFKYNINENMENACQEIDVWFRKFFDSPKCPNIIREIYDKLAKGCAYYAKLT